MGDGSQQAAHPRILLVDDEVRIVRRLVAGLLERGYEVSTAAAASDALTMLEHGNFNIVIADVAVPRKADRYSRNDKNQPDENYDVRFLADIRKTPDMATMPFMALTRDLDVKSKVRWLEAGADEYITKPCAIDEVCSRLIRVIERATAPPAPSESVEEPMDGYDLSGELSKHPAREIVQDLNRNGKTGVLRAESPSGTGEVFFARGSVIHATFEGSQRDRTEGEEAFRAVFPLDEGTFGFRSDRETIRRSLGELLLGPARRVAASQRGLVEKVLVVEADDHTSHLLATGLAERGCQVTTSRTARDALDLVEHESFDMLVADIAMPDMDGFRFRSRLRRKSGGNPPPVVFVVGEENAEQKAGSLRTDEYVTRPVVMEELYVRAVAAFWRSEARSGPRPARPVDSPDDAATRPAEESGDLARELLGRPAREVVLNVNRDEKTGVLRVESASGEGEVFFAKGYVIHATFAETEGEEAFAELFLLEDAAFDFRPDRESITRDWNELLFMAFEPGGETRQASGRRILLVDDYEPTLKVLKTYLDGHGHRVTATTSAEGALRLLEDGTFDVLIADIIMPGVDGFDFLEKVRGGRHSPTIPFMFLTADRRIESRARGFSLGVDEYLTKPCTPAELQARMAAVLRRWDASHIPQQAADLAGDLSKHPAEEIIQNLKANAKTGRLRMATPFGPGEVYFEEGNVTHGSFGGIDGEEGIYLLFALDDGTFDFLSGAKTARKLMALDTGALVLEGLRRMDETREILAIRSEVLRRAASR